ncbi:MAG: hypothetical protein V7707_12180 [Motiliproteus sp.]
MIFRCQSPFKPIACLNRWVWVPALLVALMLTLMPSLLLANTHCITATTAAHHPVDAQEVVAPDRSEHGSVASSDSARHCSDLFELTKGCSCGSCGTLYSSGSPCGATIGCPSMQQPNVASALAERRFKLPRVSNSFDNALLPVTQVTPALPSSSQNCAAVPLISAEFVFPPLFYRLCVLRL